MRDLPAAYALFVVMALCALAPAVPVPAGATGVDDEGDFGAVRESAAPLLWPEEQRRLWFDGGRLLMTAAEQERVLEADAAGRGELLDALFGADPRPETAENELRQAVARRSRLALDAFLTTLDHRARLVFLRGMPATREVVDCSHTFRPLEVWTYPELDRSLVLYRPKPDQPFRLWLPGQGKRPLYNRQMEYWLDQYHELKQYITGQRFDLQLCKQARLVDDVTGIRGLLEYRADRPTNEQVLAALAPPEDLGAWALEALVGDAPAPPPELRLDAVRLSFPREMGERMLTRLTLLVDGVEELGRVAEGEAEAEHRLVVDGIVERWGDDGGALFDSFRLRFQVPVGEVETLLPLAADFKLRPDQGFLVRMQVADTLGERRARVTEGFIVPREPVPEERSYDVVAAIDQQLSESPVGGDDSLVLVPPDTDVVMNLWRAEVITTGSAIAKVAFLLDGERQLTRSRPPFTAELRLAPYPQEHVVRVEGYSESGELLAADEIVLNQQRGELQVRIVEPAANGPKSGRMVVSADVVVPEERRVRKVSFLYNDELLGAREAPPWELAVDLQPPPAPDQITYLTAVAELDNGLRAEDVRFLNAPGFVEEVEVDLVELYTTVVDRSGQPVLGLGREAFRVLEDGREQEIAKFELVEDLPITLGVTLDVSGSMAEPLREAKQAALDFLDAIVTPRDRTFAVSFSDRARVLMPRTSDVGAVRDVLAGVRASGNTALYDAVVTSLYYFRGVRGRRALILLSDGEDSASSIDYSDAREYARRAGVTIYAIGLNIGRLNVSVRDKLQELARETGGQSFFVNKAEELRGVYADIEKQLRSQYLIAFASDRPAVDKGTFREVEVKVRGRGLEARTLRGYYP